LLTGDYRLRAFVSYIDGSDTAYDSFIVTSSKGGNEGGNETETEEENETEEDNNDNGNGGENNGGGGGITGKAVYKFKKEEISKGKSQGLKDGDKIEFNITQQVSPQEIKSEGHSLKIIELKKDRTTITISSTPITITLLLGEDAKIDLDKDNYYDLYVRLDKILNEQAYIYVQTIYEEIGIAISIPEERNETSSEEEKEDGTSNIEGGVFSLFKKIILQNKSYLLGGLGILILAILLFLIVKIARRKLKIKSNDKNRLRGTIGKEVYGENGYKMGKIKEVYLGSSKIYGWLIKLDKRISKKVDKKLVLVKHKHVNSIGKVMIIDKNAAENLKSSTYSNPSKPF
jgi:sporulation protein YlmC with PRC-barrel domain